MSKEEFAELIRPYITQKVIKGHSELKIETYMTRWNTWRLRRKLRKLAKKGEKFEFSNSL